MDSIQQALFFSHLTGKKPAVVIYDTDGRGRVNSMQYITLGYSVSAGVQTKPTEKFIDWSEDAQWTSLVLGSSKSDLVHFICKK